MCHRGLLYQGGRVGQVGLYRGLLRVYLGIYLDRDHWGFHLGVPRSGCSGGTAGTAGGSLLALLGALCCNCRGCWHFWELSAGTTVGSGTAGVLTSQLELLALLGALCWHSRGLSLLGVLLRSHSSPWVFLARGPFAPPAICKCQPPYCSCLSVPPPTLR